MIQSRFDEFVARECLEEAEAEKFALDRDEWMEYVDIFHRTIATYLREYTERGQITVCYIPKPILEESVGEYSVNIAMIFLGKKRIKLEPIGTNLIGVHGRIDMTGPNGKIKFVLVNKDLSVPEFDVKICYRNKEHSRQSKKPAKQELVWKIGTPPPHIRYFELNQESFFYVFMEVANG